MPTLKEVLWETIHHGKAGKSVDELADATGCSKSYLYRGALPVGEDGSGCRFPLDYLLPVMLAQKDYRVLRHLAHDTGHILVKIPRSKKLSPEALNRYQQTFSKAFELLCRFFTSPPAPLPTNPSHNPSPPAGRDRGCGKQRRGEQRGEVIPEREAEGRPGKDEVVRQLLKLMAETEGYRRAVERYHQRELEFGDE